MYLDSIQKHTFHIISRPLPIIQGPSNNNCSPIPGPINNSTKSLPFQDQFSRNFMMADTNNALQWEEPKSSFSADNQAEEWKTFYIRAFGYLETLGIDIGAPNQAKNGWKQIKMFTGEDRRVLQTLIGNCTITPKIQETPNLILNTIQKTMIEYQHFWQYHDGLVSDLHQMLHEPIHSLNMHIIQLNFPTAKPRTHSKSLYYNMQSDTMKPMIGFIYKTSQYPFVISSLPIAKHLAHVANNSRMHRKRVQP